MKMLCPDCKKGELAASRENIRYEESGLPYVTLRDVEVLRCPECGNQLVTIPKLAQLHRLLALTLIRKPGSLLPYEITFLRKSLGWSKADFARKLHVRPSQVSRWESESAPVPMSPSNELLLRTLVAVDQRVENYMEEMDRIELGAAPQPQMLAVDHDEQGWHMSRAA